MHGSYRRILLAVFGWLILTAQSADNRPLPKQSSQTNKVEPREQLQSAAAVAAGAIREAGQFPKPDKGCTDRKDKRDSELCAQWKAADAARDAANYGMWSVFIGLVGSGLLVWTLWETRSNSRRQLRAYVSVKVIGLDVTMYEDGGLNFAFRTLARNGGSTPAYNCNHFGFMAALPKSEAAKSFRTVSPIEPNAETGGSVIHAGEEFPSLMTNTIVVKGAALQALKDGSTNLYALGVSSYTDTFGHKRRTDFCYLLEARDFNEALDASTKRQDEAIPMEWRVAPFHNTAT